jgi:hypothetical protein
MEKRISTLLLFCFCLAGLRAQEIEVPRSQLSLVVKHTATWCPPCGGTAWTTFETLLSGYETKAVFIQAHRSRSSLFYSTAAQPLFDNADMTFGQPEFFFNTSRIGSGSGSTVTDVAELVEAAAKQKPVAQSGARFTYEPKTRELRVDVRTRFFEAAAGDYYLSVFLLVKDTVAFQEARSNNEVHKRVLRSALTETTFGEHIVSNPAAGAERMVNLSTTLDPKIAIKRVEIVTVLWRKNQQGKFDFVNANVQNELGQVSTHRLKPDLSNAEFAVTPTVVTGDITVQLNLSRSYAQLDLTLFNLLGQPVAVLHRGALPAGKQTLRFGRPGGAHNGVYLLCLSTEGEVVTRRVFLR